MLLPDVLENINDPELGGGVAFIICRTNLVRVKGSVQKKTTQISATGNIQPEGKSASPSSAEDMLDERIVIYTTATLTPGEKRDGNTIAADEILWDGLKWRITSVDNYSKWGFTIGHATRMRE